MPPQLPFAGRAPRPTWRMTVVSARDVTPRVREISLIGDDLSAFTHRPGQDLVLNLPTEAGIARRHYTVRRFDPPNCGSTSSSCCTAMRRRPAGPARRGTGTADAEGPRGRTVVNGPADWRLFTGDETALPGIAAMIESLPAGERAFAIVEVAGPDDGSRSRRRRNSRCCGCIAAARRSRRAGAHGRAGRLRSAGGRRPSLRDRRDLDGARPAQSLLARGMQKTQIAAEGYWRPGRVGGHDHIVEPDFSFGRDIAAFAAGSARQGGVLCTLPRVERGGAGARGPFRPQCHHKSSANNDCSTSRFGASSRWAFGPEQAPGAVDR